MTERHARRQIGVLEGGGLAMRDYAFGRMVGRRAISIVWRSSGRRQIVTMLVRQSLPNELRDDAAMRMGMARGFSWVVRMWKQRCRTSDDSCGDVTP